jgi:ADP-ribose pyrophosphatase
VVYEDPYLIVIRDAVRFPAENPGGEAHLGTYIRTMPPNGSAGAAALPFTGEKILLLRHFRHATRSTHLEIPRGFAEPGMSSSDLALKELEEEIKAEVDSLVELGQLHSNTGIAVDCVELFLARIRQFGRPQASEGIIGVELYTPLEIAELIRRSQITDSFTIAAFTRAWLANLLPGITSPIDVP